MEQSAIYSKVDIAKAFWQVKLDKDLRKFTGFYFRGRMYVFVRLPFGLKI